MLPSASLLLLTVAACVPAIHAAELSFELRQQHAVSASGHVVFSDVLRPDEGPLSDGSAQRVFGTSAAQSGRHTVPTRKTRLYRSQQGALVFPRRRRPDATAFAHPQSVPEDHASYWDEDEVDGPDVEKRAALLELAKMTNNAYLNPNETGWYELGKGWNVSYPFGWEPDADGFRGHVFATQDNSTVVLAIKGTSAAWIGTGGPTVIKDKFNDNLLFSCCCAYVDWTWKTVCDCAKGGWKCDQDCLEEALIEESLFYPVGINLYNNLTFMYPHSDIWITGHSLGGALAGLMGATFGAPVVAFESPGEKLAAQRLHLPAPPALTHITHVYHTADPIAMGTCTGVLSSCALGGYAMESRCHLGTAIVYDTVAELGWSAAVGKHGIVAVIEDVLNRTWAPAEQAGREVPAPHAEDDCVDCFQWEFGDFAGP